MLCVAFLTVVLNVIILSVFMLDVILLSVVMLNIIMLSVVSPLWVHGTQTPPSRVENLDQVPKFVYDKMNFKILAL